MPSYSLFAAALAPLLTSCQVCFLLPHLFLLLQHVGWNLDTFYRTCKFDASRGERKRFRESCGQAGDEGNTKGDAVSTYFRDVPSVDETPHQSEARQKVKY